MKTSFKFLAATAIAALTVSVGQAATINVGGVVWDPDSFFDFTSRDTMYENIVANVGDELKGFAKITDFNGETVQNNFCPGCELTYTFSGFVVSDINTATGQLTFSGGLINVYVDHSPNFNPALQSTAADGVLFLSMAGHEYTDNATGKVGSLHSTVDSLSNTLSGDGRGLLDVIGGLAAGNFDTDWFPSDTGPADLSFTSSFQLLPNGSFTSDDGVTYYMWGTNDIQGNSIPEPGVLGLLSIALLGIGYFSRRREN